MCVRVRVRVDCGATAAGDWFGDVVADVVVVVDAVTVGLVCSGVCVRMCVRRSVFPRPLEHIILHAKRRMWPWLLNLVEIVV